ncbi:MAG TPA: hypothetical protein VHT53_05010, partial [Candidatus Elarobacter sp.]|nr:hypothetical protein [Candidatus Elarobacter sp.]
PASGIAEPAWTTYVRVDRVEDAVARATAAGAAVVVDVPPFDAGPFQRAVVADDAGARFTLSRLVRERLG